MPTVGTYGGAFFYERGTTGLWDPTFRGVRLLLSEVPLQSRFHHHWHLLTLIGVEQTYSCCSRVTPALNRGT